MQVRRAGVGVIQATRVRPSGLCEMRREDAVNGRMIAMIFIVLVAFPVFAHAIFTVVMMVLRLMLTSVLPMAGSWSAMVGKAVLVAAFVIAVRISFGVCRRLWPATA
jgi:hypothetical protein